VRAESRSFADRVLGGSASPLIATFLRESKLSPREIDELRALLDEKARRQ
jgi:BlaI family penicillinase repressor